MAGIKDVAREAGVSASTVSYVLSGKRSISAKTTDKVMAGPAKRWNIRKGENPKGMR